MSIHFVMKQTMLFGTLNQHIPLNRWKDWKVVVVPVKIIHHPMYIPFPLFMFLDFKPL